MSRPTALDKAIDALKEKRADMLKKADALSAALEILDDAILTLKGQKVAQKVRRQASRPRPVAAMAGEKVG